MATKLTEALAKKAHSLHARLSRQHARLIAAANQMGRTGGRSGVASSAFSAGAKFGASIFGRPRQGLRAKSSEGKVAFHFRMTPVARSSEFTDLIAGRSTSKVGGGSGGDGASTLSAAHQIYIERLAAVETVSRSREIQPEAVIQNAAAATIGPQSARLMIGPDDEGYAEAAASYIDREGAVEASSSFGNIADTVAERISFWHVVEQSERRPAKHKTTINPGIDTDFWDHVAIDANAPSFLKEIAASDRDSIIVEQIPEVDAKPIYEYFVAHRTATLGEAQSIAFEPGRGGRVQTRLVLELPADMTAQQRLETARSFCEKEFAQNIRFHCAIHCPTKSNDERNYHMHITFYDRPAERMIDPSTGNLAWDFEIVETIKKANRAVISKRTFKQEKIREFQDIKWPRKIRKDYAEIVNAVRENYGMKPIYDHRSYREMDIAVEALPSLTRQEFHDVQRGRENPVAAEKIDKRWLRAMFKAADETKLAAPDKDLTKRFRSLIQNVIKRAPASIVAAKIVHGAYLDAIKKINDARLDRVALKIAAEKEISSLFPEIGTIRPGANKAKKEIEELHDGLALSLSEQERLARQGEQAAIQRLVMFEQQLKKMSLGSKSLPGYSFEQLATRAGLSATLIQAPSNRITVAPKSPPTAEPAAIPIKQPAEPMRDQTPEASQAPAHSLAPIVAPATPAAIKQSSEIVRNQAPAPQEPVQSPTPIVTSAKIKQLTEPVASIDRPAAPQPPVHSPAPIIAPAAVESKQTTAGPGPRRTIAPDIQQAVPDRPLPPIRMAPIHPMRAEPIQAKTARPKVASPAPIPEKSPAPVPPKAPLQTPTSPIRLDSTHATKTPLPPSISKSLANDKIGKSVHPTFAAPTKPVQPTAKTHAPASSALSASPTPLPSATLQVTPTAIPTAATPSDQPRPPSSPAMTGNAQPAKKPFSRDLPSASNHNNSPRETGSPSPTPASASPVPSQASDEQARKAKGRREKRRAILTTPRKSRDSYGR